MAKPPKRGPKFSWEDSYLNDIGTRDDMFDAVWDSSQREFDAIMVFSLKKGSVGGTHSGTVDWSNCEIRVVVLRA